jgi:hypothetical protein
LAVPHQEQKVYVVTSPVISDACVHVSGVDAPAPAELRTYPHCLVLDSEAHDREANDVAPAHEAGVGHAAAVAAAAAAAVVYVVVGYSMVARVVVPQTLKALLRSIQLVALVAAAYAATWSAGDDVVVVAHVEVERAATAVVVLRVQTQG